MAAQGPVIVTPRLDAKPWGGDRLRQMGIAPDDAESIGEAVITAMDAAIADGGGRTLGELVEADPTGTIGERGLSVTRNQAIFPLLVKLIDAHDDLSLQVHPDDDYAGAKSGGRELGKTEAWWVLDADPGSALYMGLQPGVTAEELASLSQAGTGIAHLFRRVPAQPNRLYFFPAGTAHALGKGVMVYEIQQPSAITYRLDDWNRRDAKGHSRELHIEDGLAVTNLDSRPEPITPREVTSVAGRRQHLMVCRYFGLERIALATGECVEVTAAGSPQTITVLEGAVRTAVGDRSVSVQRGQTAVLFANDRTGEITAGSPAVVLRGWVPEDREVAAFNG